MEPTYTPGPWKVMRIRQSNFITREVGRSDLQIHYEHIATIPQGWLMSEKQKDANARLLAVAPDLLGALKYAHERLVDNDLHFVRTGDKCAVCKLINKAEGK